MALLDWIVIGAYAILVLGVGMATGRGGGGEDEVFLAGRRLGWLRIGASTWATQLSALTFIGVPGAAIAGDFAYLQLWLGTFLAAWIVAAVFLPLYYRDGVSTVYEFLGNRLGPGARRAATLVFIVSRCLASAVRLAGCAIAVSVFFELGMTEAVLLIAALATVYVLAGGLGAVVWTDVVQLALLLGGGVVTIVWVAGALPGGLAGILEAGAAAGKLRVFDFRLDAADGTTFWLGNLFAFTLGLAVGAGDQDVAQRALAGRSAGQAKAGVLAAGAGALVSTALFLFAGAAVWAFYQAFPSDAVAALIEAGRNDHVFPHFIREELPAGLRGLLVAALFAAAMSSLDSALNGLASSAWYDLGRARPAGRRRAGPRALIAGFALLLALIALGFGTVPSILWFGLRIMGYTYGGLLGLFLLALWRPGRVRGAAAALAMLSSIPVVVLAVGWGPVAWPWSVLLGAAWTLAAAPALGAAGGRALRSALAARRGRGH